MRAAPNRPVLVVIMVFAEPDPLRPEAMSIAEDLLQDVACILCYGIDLIRPCPGTGLAVQSFVAVREGLHHEIAGLHYAEWDVKPGGAIFIDIRLDIILLVA